MERRGEGPGWNGYSGNDSWLGLRVKERCEPYPRAAQFDAEDSDTFILTSRAMKYIEDKEYPQAGFAMHLSLLKPHPPWAAPFPYNTMYNPESLSGYGDNSLEEERNTHPWIDMIHNQSGKFAKYGDSTTAKLVDEDQLRKIKSSYYGLVTELDSNIGRLIQCLKKNNVYNNTLIVFTADHGEMLGE